MADQGEASQIVQEEAGQVVNTETREGRDSRLADIKSRAMKLGKNVFLKTHEAARGQLHLWRS